ncbi:hypothetical protein, partial [Mesorhizobium sp. BR1-1-7]|uniref:hypothetical protein n=1 Tax=Mesorhizobium sp. BR1-1-7 TaxID=2876647 RepID=UPI00398D00A4
SRLEQNRRPIWPIRKPHHVAAARSTARRPAKSKLGTSCSVLSSSPSWGKLTFVAESAGRDFNINFGPQHPAAHGVVRVALELAHIGLLRPKS